MKALLQIRKKLKPAHFLAVLFLVYIFYVGLAGLPALMYHFGGFLYWETGYHHFIDTVNEQYEGMLTTQKDQPLLQNKGSYINFNGLLAKSLGQPMMHDRVKLANGHLTSVVPTAADPDEIQSVSDNIIRFSRMQTDHNKHFLFVMAPSQISKYEDLLPTGYTDTTNQTADQLLAMLNAAGVSTLDLREKLHSSGMSVTDTFFTTDHHWLPQTGFWAYTQILEQLADMGTIGPVQSFYTNQENYTFQTFEDTFLGSWGKRTGIYYAGVDDSIFIRPNFKTDIRVSIAERNLNLRGGYEDICYNTDVSPDYTDPDYYQDNMYGLYGWGDTQLTQWRNENAPESGKFLLIGESFGNVPFSLLSIYLSSCDEMDMRYFSDNFSEYYEDYCPDTVILLVNIDQTISANTTYPFFATDTE